MLVEENMAVTMLLSRSACVLRQYPQRRLLLANAFYTPERNSYREDRYKYEYEQTRNFRNFGHTRKKSSLSYALPVIIPGIAMIICMTVDWQWLFNLIPPKVDAASMLVEETPRDNENMEQMEQDLQKKKKSLGLDQYKRYDPKNIHTKLELELDEDSIFYKLGSAGLITFSDYIFLLTVLSTSRRHFEIAFRMFDFNGDGDVDSEEFGKVATLIRQQTSIGTRHRDHATTGNTFKGVNSALTTYFFGPQMNQKLTIEKFLDFQQQLQREILSLEFERRNPDEDGNITEVDFTELLLAYAGYTAKKKAKMLKRVKKTFKEDPKGISKEEYLKFFHFLNNINDVDTALTFYHIAGASIDQATLKHVAKTVAHVDLTDHIIQVVYTIFDENNSQIVNKEETSKQEIADVLSIGQYFQDIFSEHLAPLKIEFGHVCENPSEWEQRFEQKDFDNNRHSGKIKWGNKNGDYGEQYWDLNH
ncbi:calcium-binding atopy-related autoantigen 1 [Lasius niger]|uniref:Calcium-binding atopy-related autoantigen 1 n=1 Tax=Lasius niger TaxID=67767 RepID=A0A0J7L5D5_LASNI|nr:calcium-binding atopy-related autoantigen 1 [Lasius niger]